MTDEPTRAIPFDDHPDPVIAYSVTDGEARVTGTNAAFDAAFDAVSTGQPVDALFERFATVETLGATDRAAGDPGTLIARGADVTIRLSASESGSYTVRPIATDAEGGVLVFRDRADATEDGQSPGVGDVASVLSHDLRNPLDVATAHLTAARETGAAEHFDAVEQAHDRMEQIIQDVLTLASGPDAITPVEGVAVAEAAEQAWRSVDTERASLRQSDGLPETTADPGGLRRLLENLFRNAVEHGGEEVTVTISPLPDGFYVEDTGPGIDADDQGAILSPGYTTKDGGTGLGLAIVERIASAHGWSLTLTSGTDGGARIEVQFS